VPWLLVAAVGNMAAQRHKRLGRRRTFMGITVRIEGDKLIIELPINKDPQPSASGKTLVVATTHGNVTTEVMINGKPVVIGVNAYVKK
jgi:hypothetical protein